MVMALATALAEANSMNAKASFSSAVKCVSEKPRGEMKGVKTDHQTSKLSHEGEFPQFDQIGQRDH